jgi:prepilin-type N-terminal cleavage/methylation domain
MTGRSTPGARTRAGTTLVELLVVLLVLGIATTIAGLAFHRTRATPTPETMMIGRIAAARREAIAAGRDVLTMVLLDGRPHAVTAHADGTVLADSLPALDPLSGQFSTDTADVPR